jgi:multicomponent Na+:H+ antiporter subunit E
LAHALTLLLALFLLWLMLSGYVQALLIGLGAASCVMVVVIAHRMDVIDEEGQPVDLRLLRLFRYWMWLAREVVLSNLDVTRRILARQMPISPTVVRLKASQGSAMGRVIYANSITLTPGTVSIDLKGDEITVHALTREGAEQLLGGEMDRRITAIEKEG